MEESKKQNTIELSPQDTISVAHSSSESNFDSKVLPVYESPKVTVSTFGGFAASIFKDEVSVTP